MRSFTLVRAAAIAALALTAAACAGPRPLYVPYGGSTYGYADRPIGAETHEVSYRAPVYTTYAYGRATRERVVEEQLAMAHDMALLRAADIAQVRGMPAFRELNRDNDVRVDVEDDPFYDPWGYRPYPCRGCGPGYYTAPYMSRDRRTVVDVTVRIQVRLEPRLVSGAYNANEVRQKIVAAYPNALPKTQDQARAAAPGAPIGSFNAPPATPAPGPAVAPQGTVIPPVQDGPSSGVVQPQPSTP